MPGRSKDPAERARKRQAAIDAGLMRGTPDVVRVPFGAGNEVAVTHGAYSDSVLSPRAAAKMEQWLADPDFPEHAKKPYLRDVLRSYAWIRARIDLYWEMCDELGPERAIEELTTTTEKVTGSMEDGTFKRTAKSRKRMAPEETLRRWDASALKYAEQLGLTPMARAKLGKDVSSTAVNLAQVFTESEED